MQEVPRADTKRYGIVAGTLVNDHLDGCQHIVEKPKPEEAPSTLGVVGRYILTPGVFHRDASSRAVSAARSS